MSKLTFTGEVGSEPLSSCVVEEALGVSKAHSQVARVTRELEHRLQGELRHVRGTIV